MITSCSSIIYFKIQFLIQKKRLHGYSCNRNRFADREANPKLGVLIKFVYIVVSLPDDWRFAYEKLIVCLRETTLLVPANFRFHYFKLGTL